MILVAVVLGAVLGLVGSKILFVGSALSLIPWAVAAFTIGYFSETKKEVLIYGGVFGFVLSFVFMLSGYNGSDSVFSKIPFFILFGIFGAICAAVWSFIAFFVRSILNKKK